MNKTYSLRSACVQKKSNQNSVSSRHVVELKRKCDEIYQDSSRKRAKNAKESDVYSNRQIVTRAAARNAIVAVVSPENEGSRDSYSDEVGATSSSEEVLMSKESQSTRKKRAKNAQESNNCFDGQIMTRAASRSVFVAVVSEESGSGTGDEGSSGSDEIASTSSSDDVLMVLGGRVSKSRIQGKQKRDEEHQVLVEKRLKKAEEFNPGFGVQIMTRAALHRADSGTGNEGGSYSDEIAATSSSEDVVMGSPEIVDNILIENPLIKEIESCFEKKEYMQAEAIGRTVMHTMIALTSREKARLEYILSVSYYKQCKVRDFQLLATTIKDSKYLNDKERSHLYLILTTSLYVQKMYVEVERVVHEGLMIQNLSDDERGLLYNTLSLARLQQGKYEEAKGLDEAMSYLYSLSREAKVRICFSLFQIYKASSEFDKAIVNLLTAARFAEYCCDIKLKNQILIEIYKYNLSQISDYLSLFMKSWKNERLVKIDIIHAEATFKRLIEGTYLK